jgi:hypothetical protein
VKVEVALGGGAASAEPLFLDVQVLPENPAEDRSCYSWEARWRLE